MPRQSSRCRAGQVTLLLSWLRRRAVDRESDHRHRRLLRTQSGKAIGALPRSVRNSRRSMGPVENMRCVSRNYSSLDPLRFSFGRSCKLATSRASAVFRDALSLAAVLAGIGFAGRAVGWILSYSGVALIALWLIWIKGPMAIERFDLATALPSTARSVLRWSFGPRSQEASTPRIAPFPLILPR